MSFGFWGKILRIDLAKRTAATENLVEDFFRDFLGGRNFVAVTLLKEVPPGTDPLSAENRLVIATSVLTGTPIPGSSRFTVGAKSPLTNGYGESEAGGWWGPELKKAGYDIVIVEGRAPQPVYISIRDEQVEIRDARHLWGKETGDAQEEIRRELGDSTARILQIGPAGENLVRYAAIVSDLIHVCGRSGMGAVMGSKRLRAIAVRGTGRVPIKDLDAVREYARWFASNVGLHPGLRTSTELGTAKLVIPLNMAGLEPTSNFRKGYFEGAEAISGERIRDTLPLEKESCFACPVRCKKSVEHTDARWRIERRYGSPQWETLGSLGPNCEVGDLLTICKANEMCNKYGLDSISTGVTIAFAMECMEKGIISLGDTGGIDLRFGNGEALLKMIENIALRRGFGDLLAEGSARAAQRIGKGAAALSMTVKMQELPAHEPRGKWGVGLGYAVSPTGADHLIAAHDGSFTWEGNPEPRLAAPDISDLHVFGIRKPVPAASLGPEKVRLFVHLEYLWGIYNVLDLCLFVGVPTFRMMTITQLLDLLRHVTGWEISFWELVKASEKGINLTRLFNVKHGFAADDDTLPDRMFEPLLNGANKGLAIDRAEFTRALRTYYQMHGWDSQGVPTAGKLAELGLYEYSAEDDPTCHNLG